MQVCKYLDDLPAVPDKFIKHAWELLETPTDDVTPNWMRPDYIVRKLNKNGKSTTSTRTFRYDMGEEFHQWVRDNIVENFTEASISMTPASIGPHMGAHTDFSNNFRFMYMLDTGGDNCETNFYQEKGEDYYRPGKKWINVDDFDRLELRDTFHIPKNRWILMNTQFLHSVENITSNRVAIHITVQTPAGIKADLSGLYINEGEFV